MAASPPRAVTMHVGRAATPATGRVPILRTSDSPRALSSAVPATFPRRRFWPCFQSAAARSFFACAPLGRRPDPFERQQHPLAASRVSRNALAWPVTSSAECRAHEISTLSGFCAVRCEWYGSPPSARPGCRRCVPETQRWGENPRTALSSDRKSAETREAAGVKEISGQLEPSITMAFPTAHTPRYGRQEQFLGRAEGS